MADSQGLAAWLPLALTLFLAVSFILIGAEGKEGHLIDQLPVSPRQIHLQCLLQCLPPSAVCHSRSDHLVQLASPIPRLSP